MGKTTQQIIDENSKAWHNADAAGKKYLEEQNKRLHGELDAANGTSSSLNTATGKWEVTGGGGSYGGSSGNSGSSGGYLDDYGNIDYSKKWSQDIASGADLETLKQTAADRLNKVMSQGGSYKDYANDSVQIGMDNYIRQKETEYKQQQLAEAERRMIEGEIGRVVNGLEGQKYGINQSADELARQAYIKNMQSKRTMPQELSAAGYSGGMADSQKLALELGLRNEQADIATNRNSALNGVDTAIQDAQQQGSIEGARAEMARAQAAIDQYNQYTLQKMQMDNTDYWKRQGMENDDKWNQKNMDYDNMNTVRAYVMSLLESGVMPNTDMLKSANMSQLEAQDIANQYKANAAAVLASKGGSSGGSGGSGKPKLTYSQALEILKSGVESPAALEVYKQYTGVPWRTPEEEYETIPEGFTQDPIALGFGPMGAAGLAQKLQTGEVVAMNIGGQLYYKRNKAQGDESVFDFLTERRKLFGR